VAVVLLAQGLAPPGAEACIFCPLKGTAEQVAEKIEFQAAAPEGAIDNTALTLCLKA
jgi:hypothetical protein